MSETKDDQASAAKAAPSSPEPAAEPDAPPADPAASPATGSGSPAAEAADDAAEQLRRRVRRSAKIDAPEAAAPPAEEQGAQPPASDAPPAKKRRRRRRRTKPARSEGAQGDAQEAAVAPMPDAEGDSPVPTRARRTRRRVKPPSEPPPERPARRPRDGAQTSRPATTRATSSGARTAARPAPGTRAKETERRSERQGADGGPRKGAKPPQSPGKGEDMITLLLHPPPKAAPMRRKKAGRPMTAKEALKAKAAKRKSGGRAKGAAGSVDATPQEVELSEAWLNADDSSACDCVEAAGAGAPQLVQAWQQQPNAEAIAAVAYATGDSIPSAARKAARRALSVLKSRGVDVPDRPVEAVGPSGTGAAADGESEPLVATFVPPDTNGMTFFSISQRLAGGRYRVADVVIRNELGILHASSGKLAGKQIRRWRQRVESRLGTPPVSVPVDWARFRIAQARKQNGVSGQVLPLGLDSCASMFEPVPDAEPTHPVAHLGEDFKEAEVAAATTDSEQLHNEPEFRSWLPDKNALDEMLRNVGTRVGAEGADDRELVDKVLAEEMESSTLR